MGTSDNSGCILVTAAMAVIILLVYWMVQSSMAYTAEWEKFKVDHECEIVAKKDSQSISGFAINPSNGQLSMVNGVSDSQTAWACNDGVTYWK